MNFINIKNICKTSILSVLLFLLFTHNLQSQCLGCPTIDIPCVGDEGGGVPLFLRINSFGEGNVCAACCEQPSCRRTMYQVQLGIKGSYLPNFTGQCFSLNYTELILQAGITTQEGWLTSLNKKLTEICPGPGLANSPNDGSLYSLIADEGSDITTLTLGGVLTDPGEPVLPHRHFVYIKSSRT